MSKERKFIINKVRYKKSGAIKSLRDYLSRLTRIFVSGFVFFCGVAFIDWKGSVGFIATFYIEKLLHCFVIKEIGRYWDNFYEKALFEKNNFWKSSVLVRRTNSYLGKITVIFMGFPKRFYNKLTSYKAKNIYNPPYLLNLNFIHM
jgi:hypothetical protein